MKKMIRNGLALLTACCLATACSDDDMTGQQRHNDGNLHFKFTLNNADSKWNEDGTPRSRTRLKAPIDVQLPDGMTQPLYLHCVETDNITTPQESELFTANSAVTRGERITREAFDGDKIKCFGLYAKIVDGESVLDAEFQKSEFDKEGEWYVKEQDLLFPGDMGWTSELVSFYGFAPAFGAGDDHASCYYVETETEASEPTIHFSMEPDEADNKDILTASNLSVTKAQSDEKDIELKFRHVLSAIKFQVESSDFKTYQVGYGSAATNKYVKITKLTLKNIYKNGYATLGNEYTDADDNRTSNWTYEDTDENKGECYVVTNKTPADMGNDDNDKDKLLINTDEHCLMVLPQTVPDDAKLIITVNLYEDETCETLYRQDVPFEVSLAGLVWLPGYSYTYKLRKDSNAFEYILDSDPATITFEAEGGDQTFSVLSYVQRLNAGGTEQKKAAFWHLEYSEDGGTTWNQGLPGDFTLTNPDGVIVSDNAAIEGCTTATEYTLTASVRSNELESVTNLQQHDYTPYAGSDGFYDLSLHEIGFSPEVCGNSRPCTTANCYIISGYGKFKLPLIYGNGWKLGSDNKSAYNNKIYDGTNRHVFVDHNGNDITYPWIFNGGQLPGTPSGAEIVWSDIANVVSNVSVSGDYLCFEILQKNVRPANVLLAVKDGNDIAWSWHIWVMADASDFTKTKQVSHTLNDNTYTMKVAGCNLGWSQPEVENFKEQRQFKFRIVQNDPLGKTNEHNTIQHGGVLATGGSDVIYQGGRKDPFPSSMLKKMSVELDGDGNVTSIVYDQRNLFEDLGIGVARSDMRYDMKEAIKEPNMFVLPTATRSWVKQYGENTTTPYDYQKYPLWNPELYEEAGTSKTNVHNYAESHTKTIYDPSPVGFIVPNSGVIEMLLEDSYEYNDKIEVDGNQVNASVPYITGTTTGITFYLTGRRVRKNNELQLEHFRTNCYLWTAGLDFEGSYGAYLEGGENSMSNSPVDINHSRGFSLRPIADAQKDVVQGVGTPLQADLRGVSLTKYSTSGTSTYWGIDFSNVEFTIEGDKQTVEEIVNNPNYEDVRVYISNLRVNYSASSSGFIYYYRGVFRAGQSSVSSTGNNSSNKTLIDNRYWERIVENPDDPTNGDYWKNLVRINCSNSNITINSVTTDIRIFFVKKSN